MTEKQLRPPVENPIRVALVSPSPAARSGLRAMLQELPQILFCAEAVSLDQLTRLPLFDSNQPGDQPQLDLIIAASWSSSILPLVEGLPRLADPAAVLLVTSETLSVRFLKAARAVTSGRAWGVISPDAALEDLHAAIDALRRGLWVAPIEQVLMMAGEPLPAVNTSEDDFFVDDLTERENEILQWIGQGLTNKQIAAHLGISEHTVKYHIASIYSKLGASNRTEAARIGARRGLISL